MTAAWPWQECGHSGAQKTEQRGPSSMRTCVSRAAFGGVNRNVLDEERRARKVEWAQLGIVRAEPDSEVGSVP